VQRAQSRYFSNTLRNKTRLTLETYLKKLYQYTVKIFGSNFWVGHVYSTNNCIDPNLPSP